MATYATNQTQATNEIRTYTIDYTKDLPTGGSVSSGTATHTPPSGSAGTVTTSVSSPYIYATLPAQSVVGVHYIDVLATFSDGDKSSVRVPINIVYGSPTARSGMSNLILELRGMTEAGAADYTIAGVPYWSDSQLQDILDIHRTDIVFEQLESFPVMSTGGSFVYHDYRSRYDYLEATTGGTAIMYLQDAAGSSIGSANYTPDYRRGQFQFTADQAGTVYYLTGRSYDVTASAADIWRRKAAHYAPTSFNFSTDNHSVSRAAVYENCVRMAEYFESKGGSAIQSVGLFRGDMEE